MSEMTPSVMMRSTKYWEPSCTAAAYLQAHNRNEINKARKTYAHSRRLKFFQNEDSNSTAFNTNTGVSENYLDMENGIRVYKLFH